MRRTDPRCPRPPHGRRALAPVLVLAVLLGACASSDPQAGGAGLEDPASDPEAPGVEAPDGADVTPSQFRLPPLEVVNGRGYAYEVDIELQEFAAEARLGDPGKEKLFSTQRVGVAVRNLLDDRPAPFGASGEGTGGVLVSLLFELDPGLAAEMHELLTGPPPGTIPGPGALATSDLGGRPFVLGAFPSYGSDLATAGRAPGDLLASEVAAWTIWTVDRDQPATAPQSPVQHYGNEYGWPTDVIDALVTLMAGAPTYVRLEVGEGVLGTSNCDWADGGRSLVLYYDVAAERWLDPEEVTGGSACGMANYKPPKD